MKSPPSPSSRPDGRPDARRNRAGRPDRRGGKVAPDPTRDIAFDIVEGVIVHRRMLDTSLEHSAAARTAEPRDRAAAHRLAATVLRHMGTANEVLAPFLKREPPEPVRVVLLIGVAQLLFLDTPPHAAVATSVALARRRGLVPFAGLVNAVLRRVAGGGAEALEGLDQPRLDVPAWLWQSWGRLARPIASALGHEPPLDLTIKPGCEAPPGGEVMPNGSVRFAAGTVKVAELPGFAEGTFWVQDMAATLPARLLNVTKGERVADLCAAPGGKTAQLACAGAEVFAIEREGRRLERLRANLARLGLADVKVIHADAATWKPEAPLDAILLDAPCSATGTIRRHPDAMWIKRPRDIATMTEGQDRLLAAARDMLRPGGRLVYAVCSLQPEEGEQRARAAQAMGLIPDPFTPEELAFLPQARTPEGWLRTHPGMLADHGGMDGFFAARFRRG
ncbi:RsmB/NOP family class I SAM-dependent RNA methyltransferase [Komagataeibacter sucrofermentans]|uniref:rRNA cytosine-C5-methylase n=1 Tax=Komagataeibacter sucrofermentans TaxID=1053551 RepID=A0A318QMT4_9PROT|nr:transcription antitermination factor NusB [Komagataeibacter sucrofermentans]PYD78661.1 rRNA cytosine-C5-methylase [Komagataeibacter sucrofermentans]GBQ53238.1 tRNA/rRNA cytosine-C5-methylase Nol1/Nop2/Sun [Komagataeibacter sucrofermentans DSM 15973]